MIVVDTSALAALYLAEPPSTEIEERLKYAGTVLVPVTTMIEFASLQRFGSQRFGWLDLFLQRFSAPVLGLDAEAAETALAAARRYGKGSGHPAQLNFGDCLVYAVAKYRDLPLLFVGDDFRHTDITPALKV